METSVDLRSLADAERITPQARETVGMLVDEYGRHTGHNEELRRYYDGDVRVSDYDVTAADTPNDQTCDWPEKAVSAWAECIRFARIPNGLSCGFCTMLASRGFVYASRESAGEFTKFHDHCDCRIVAGDWENIA